MKQLFYWLIAVLVLGTFSMCTSNLPPTRTLHISQERNGNLTIRWTAVDGAASYNIYRSSSRIGQRVRVATDVQGTTFTDPHPHFNRFYNYYWVVAVNAEGEYFINPQPISFHTEMFGPGMIVFNENDCTFEIEREINRIGDVMRTHANAVQNSINRYALYFMPGDYFFEGDASLGVGYYMTISGLGRLSSDTRLHFEEGKNGIFAHADLPLCNIFTNAPIHGTGVYSMEKMREKPFLYFDQRTQRYNVFVPVVDDNNAEGNPVGRSIDLENNFFIALPGDSVEEMNVHLAAGHNLLLSPGMFEVEVPIFVGNPNTVVLGIGMATVFPGQDNIEGAVIIGDVSGVVMASIVLNAY